MKFKVGQTVKIIKRGAGDPPLGSIGTVIEACSTTLICMFGDLRWCMCSDELEKVNKFKVGDKIRYIGYKLDNYFNRNEVVEITGFDEDLIKIRPRDSVHEDWVYGLNGDVRQFEKVNEMDETKLTIEEVSTETLKAIIAKREQQEKNEVDFDKFEFGKHGEFMTIKYDGWTLFRVTKDNKIIRVGGNDEDEVPFPLDQHERVILEEAE